MQVKEVLRVKGNRLVSAEPAGRAVEAVSTMAKENLGSLVVMEQGRMVGMLTFHELLRALASRGGALGELRVGDIMVRDPVTAAPEMEVNDLRRTMLESGARYLPVMQDGRLLGVISFRDVAKAVLEEQDFENKMLKGYITLPPAQRRGGSGRNKASGIRAARACRGASRSTSSCARHGTASTLPKSGTAMRICSAAVIRAAASSSTRAWTASSTRRSTRGGCSS